MTENPPICPRTWRLKAMVAPNAKLRDPALAATCTEGMNHSLMNIEPSIDQTPWRETPRYGQVTIPTSASSSGATTFAR